MNDKEREAAERALEAREHAQAQDQEQKPTSLGRVEVDQGREPAIPHGYLELHKDAMPSGGAFYPEGLRIFTRAASVAAVRHWSTLDPDDPFSVEAAMSDIVHDGTTFRGAARFSYKDILEEDRIHVVLAIKEHTFAKGENRLVVGAKCESCGHDNEIEVRNEAFRRVELDEETARYYDEERREFVFRTKSFGEIAMRPPTIGTVTKVAEYIQNERKARREVDLSFVKVLPFIAPDWRRMDADAVRNLHVAVMGWSREKFMLMTSLVERVRVGVQEALFCDCTECGAEVRTPVTFPGGVKALFSVSDLSGELI